MENAVDKAELYKVIAIRLAAARRVAGLTQIQVAQQIDHKTMTQVSLWESGARLPTVTDLFQMAQLYGVPMDFLVGLSDDALADTTENNQGFLVNMVASAIQKQHTAWLASTAQVVALTIGSQGKDRDSLLSLRERMTTMRTSFDRFTELNPEFAEDMAGSANLLKTIIALEDAIQEATARIAEEARQRQVLDRELQVADGVFARKAQAEVNLSVNQMMLDIAS